LSFAARTRRAATVTLAQKITEMQERSTKWHRRRRTDEKPKHSKYNNLLIYFVKNAGKIDKAALEAADNSNVPQRDARVSGVC